MSKQPGTRLFLAVFVLAIIVLPAHVFAETSQPPNPPPERAAELLQGTEAVRVDPDQPNSGESSWLTLTISFADEEPVTVYIPDGGLATYHSYEYDQKFGIVARTRGPESDEVDVQLVTFTGKRPHYRAEEVLETIPGRLGFSLVGTPRTTLPVEIKAERMAGSANHHAAPLGSDCRPQPDILLSLSAPFEQWNNTTGCCVSCAVGEYCGCGVESACGTCTTGC